MASRNRLAAVTKQLLNSWEQTKDHWRDQKAMEFEKQYLEELKSGVNGAMEVMEKLDRLINKVRRDCE